MVDGDRPHVLSVQVIGKRPNRCREFTEGRVNLAPLAKLSCFRNSISKWILSLRNSRWIALKPENQTESAEF